MAARKTKSVPIKSIVLKDNILWAVIERRLLHPQVYGVYTAEDNATQIARELDDAGGLSFNKYIVQRVELDPID